jgi:hypothetical protein
MILPIACLSICKPRNSAFTDSLMHTVKNYSSHTFICYIDLGQNHWQQIIYWNDRELCLTLNRILYLWFHASQIYFIINNQRDAALTSRVYYSLRDYMFRVLSAPIISSTLKLQMQSQVQVMCRCAVGLNPLKQRSSTHGPRAILKKITRNAMK